MEKTLAMNLLDFLKTKQQERGEANCRLKISTKGRKVDIRENLRTWPPG